MGSAPPNHFERTNPAQLPPSSASSCRELVLSSCNLIPDGASLCGLLDKHVFQELELLCSGFQLQRVFLAGEGGVSPLCREPQ